MNTTLKMIQEVLISIAKGGSATAVAKSANVSSEAVVRSWVKTCGFTKVLDLQEKGVEAVPSIAELADIFPLIADRDPYRDPDTLAPAGSTHQLDGLPYRVTPRGVFRFDGFDWIRTNHELDDFMKKRPRKLKPENIEQPKQKNASRLRTANYGGSVDICSILPV